jgi:hypothetical protein
MEHPLFPVLWWGLTAKYFFESHRHRGRIVSGGCVERCALAVGRGGVAALCTTGTVPRVLMEGVAFVAWKHERDS